MNKISSRQLYFFLACVLAAGKLVVLPAKLSQYSGNDLLIPLTVQYLVQTAVVFCVLLLAKRKASLSRLLVGTFGSVLGKILLCLHSLFLIYAAILPLLEQKLLVQGAFYDTIPSLVAFAPFFLTSAYLCSKPLGSYGRIFDLLAPIYLFALAGILLFSVSSADYGALLPFGGTGMGAIAKGVAFSSSWFFDGAILLSFLGKFDYKKGMALKGALFYLLGGLGVIFFTATFYGIFAETAQNQLFAFTGTGKYFSGITVLGRVDFLFIYALSLVLVFTCVIPLKAGIDGLLKVFGERKYLPTILSVAVNLLMIVLCLCFDYGFGKAVEIFSQKGFWIFPVFSVAVPPLCLLLRRKNHEG